MASFVCFKFKALFNQDLPADEARKIVQALARSSPQASFLVLRVLINGWPTSARFQESPTGPCLFGCAGCKDDLKHYLHCPQLHFAAAQSFGESSLFEPPAARFGLRCPLVGPEVWRAAVLTEIYLTAKGTQHSSNSFLTTLMLRKIATAAALKVRPWFRPPADR